MAYWSMFPEDDWKSEYLQNIADNYDYQYILHCFSHNQASVHRAIEHHRLGWDPLNIVNCTRADDDLYNQSLLALLRYMNNLLNAFVVQRHDDNSAFDPSRDWVFMLLEDALTLGRQQAERDVLGLNTGEANAAKRRVKL